MMNQSDQEKPMKEWISEKEEIKRFLNSRGTYDKNYFHFRKELYSQQTLRQRFAKWKRALAMACKHEKKKGEREK